MAIPVATSALFGGETIYPQLYCTAEVVDNVFEGIRITEGFLLWGNDQFSAQLGEPDEFGDACIVNLMRSGSHFNWHRVTDDADPKAEIVGSKLFPAATELWINVLTNGFGSVTDAYITSVDNAAISAEYDEMLGEGDGDGWYVQKVAEWVAEVGATPPGALTRIWPGGPMRFHGSAGTTQGTTVLPPPP